VNQKLGKYVYLFLQSLRKEDITGILTEIEESQWFSREKLLEIQWTRFKDLLEYSYKNIPYYQKIFKEAGITPDDIKSRVDTSKIPILTKDDIRANFEDLQAPGKHLVELNRTSGSTGQSLRVVRDRASTGYHRANMFRFRRWYDADIGSFEATFRILNFPFWERQTVRMKDFILNRIRINERDLNERTMHRFCKKLESARPATFYGFPSLMVRFAEFLKKQKIEPCPESLKVIIATSEMLYPKQKEILEDFFKSPVVNEYGCTETGIIAIECPDGAWHVPIESCLVEIVPVGGLEDDDDVGKVIVTDLMNRAMPFIRYDPGDLARKSSGECICGRGLPTIEGVEGRIGQLVDLPDGRSVHAFIFLNIFKRAEKKSEESIKEFQVIFTPPKDFTFYVVPDKNFNQDVLDYIKKRLKFALGEGCDFSFEFVIDIERAPSGKQEKFIIQGEGGEPGN
jgi:phenylacetate-CoA ligase